MRSVERKSTVKAEDALLVEEDEDANDEDRSKRSVRMTRAGPGNSGKSALDRETKTTCRCRDHEGMEVRCGDASEREIDRVLDDDEDDRKHEGHDDGDHDTDCRKSMGRRPPDTGYECSGSANENAGYPAGMSERLKERGATAPGEGEIQRP